MAVKVLSGEHAVHIGITARTEQIVEPPAVLIVAVTGQAVIGDGDQRTQKRQVRPYAIMGAHMRSPCSWRVCTAHKRSRWSLALQILKSPTCTPTGGGRGHGTRAQLGPSTPHPSGSVPRSFQRACAGQPDHGYARRTQCQPATPSVCRRGKRMGSFCTYWAPRRGNFQHKR